MANTYEKLRDLLEGEIDEIVKGGSLDKEKLHCLYEMVDVIKDVGEITEQEGGYSQANRMYVDPMMMYAYAANNNRANNSRYSRANYNRGGSYGGGSYAGGRGGNSSRGGYSRGGDVMENLERMMGEAQSEQEREAIRQVMEMM